MLQLKYSNGQVEELAAPWAERFARVGKLLQAFVVRLLQACPNAQKVCALTGLSWHTVNTILHRAVDAGMAHRKIDQINYLGIDEKSMERGHSDASILTDISGSRVLDVVPKRTSEAASLLLGTLTPAQQAGVKGVAMDMWPAFMGAVKQRLPQADIVHDRFHVAKYLNDAVNATRWQEHRILSQQGQSPSPLTGSKYPRLKTYTYGRSSEAVAFRTLNQMNLKTCRAWRIKENFNNFWTYRYTESARKFFASWSTNAMRNRLKPVQKVVEMLRRHQEGRFNYSRHPIRNACAEGFNNAIQLIKANARGFRNFANYRARILFYCGKVELKLE